MNIPPLQGTVDQLQQAYKEHVSYRELLQECEKWILQMSLKVISHNALNVSTIELAEEQVQRHEVRTAMYMYDTDRVSNLW